MGRIGLGHLASQLAIKLAPRLEMHDSIDNQPLYVEYVYMYILERFVLKLSGMYSLSESFV